MMIIAGMFKIIDPVSQSWPRDKQQQKNIHENVHSVCEIKILHSD